MINQLLGNDVYSSTKKHANGLYNMRFEGTVVLATNLEPATLFANQPALVDRFLVIRYKGRKGNANPMLPNILQSKAPKLINWFLSIERNIFKKIVRTGDINLDTLTLACENLVADPNGRLYRFELEDIINNSPKGKFRTNQGDHLKTLKFDLETQFGMSLSTIIRVMHPVSQKKFPSIKGVRLASDQEIATDMTLISRATSHRPNPLADVHPLDLEPTHPMYSLRDE